MIVDNTRWMGKYFWLIDIFELNFERFEKENSIKE